MSDDGNQDQPLDHLRALLLRPTNEKLEELESKNVDADQVSQVLAEAVRKSSRRDSQLGAALGPTLSEAFKDSVRRDPQSLADAISPIMGPAIRRSIQEAIRSMVQSLNTILDHSLSPKGLRWRLEAWRTGRSFGEVVLLHTLVYRTEHIWLVDQETGLLMQSISAEPDQDVSLMSAMLAAIQDFGRDSFDSDELVTMRFADLIVWIQHSPRAYLAAAFQGSPPQSLRQKLQETLDRIHVQHADLLAKFNGDTEPMNIIGEDLEELLEAEFVNAPVQHPEDDAETSWHQKRRWIVPAALTSLVLLWFIVRWQHGRYLRHVREELDLPNTVSLSIDDDVLRLGGSAYSDQIHDAEKKLDRFPELSQLDISSMELVDHAWVRFLDLVAEDPGMTAIQTERIKDRFFLHGIRDTTSTDPDLLLRSAGVRPEDAKVVWTFVPILDQEPHD